MMHGRQSMIVKGSLVDRPNEPKCNQHVVGAYVHIHTNTSFYDCLCRQGSKLKKKYQNGCHLKTIGQNH